MATETLVQGEHDFSDLTDSVVGTFMACDVVLSLAAAGLGRDLTSKHKALQDGSNFLLQAVRDIRGDRGKEDVLNALLRAKREEEELPPRVDEMSMNIFRRTHGFPPYYSFISPEEAVYRLESYKSTLDNLQKGTIDPDQVKKARRFFSQFARIKSERSRKITSYGFF